MKLDFANGLRVLLGLVMATVLHGCNDTANSASGNDAKLTVSIPHASSNRAARTVVPDYIHTITVTVVDTAENAVAHGEIAATGGDLSLIVPSNLALHVKGAALDQDRHERFSGNKAVPPIAAGTTATVSLTLDALTPLSAAVQAAGFGTLTVPDNTTAVTVITTNAQADQHVHFDITGGADQSFFNIDASSGQLSFKNPPLSSTPLDENKDNVYEVQVTFTDGFESVTQDLKVAVGNLDMTFGRDHNGIVTQDFSPPEAASSSSDKATAMVVQPDDKIVVAGTTNINTNVTNDSALVRYLPNGVIDPSFGTQGVAILSLANATVEINAMALQSNGMIVVAGTATVISGKSDFLLARFDKDGKLDTGFGSNGTGIVTTDFATVLVPSSEVNSVDSATALVIQADQLIVVAGQTDYDPTGGVVDANFAVARYNSFGELDSQFGTAALGYKGVVVNDIGPVDDRVAAIALQPGGKIVVAGSSRFDSYDFVLVRYSSNGTLDTSFNQSGSTPGIVIKDLGSLSTDQVFAMVVQPDETPGGKIVVAGQSSGAIAIARYTNDGILDQTFGVKSDGTSDGTKVDPYQAFMYAMALQADNKLVLAGTDQECNCNQFIVARYQPDGSVDNSFGTNGKVTTQSSDVAMAYAIALQANGKIVAAGQMNDDFGVVRYNP